MRRHTINTLPSTRRTRHRHKRRHKLLIMSFAIRIYQVNKDLEDSRHKGNSNRNNHPQARRIKEQQTVRPRRTKPNRPPRLRPRRNQHHIRTRRSRVRMRKLRDSWAWVEERLPIRRVLQA